MDVCVHCLSLVAGGAKIDDLDNGALEVLEENVLRLQITVNQLRLAEQCKTIDQLLGKYAHQRGGKATELVLLDQLVQIDAQQFED